MSHFGGLPGKMRPESVVSQSLPVPAPSQSQPVTRPTVRTRRPRQLEWLLLTACLWSPTGLAVVRKLVPNQPPWIDESASVVVGCAALLAAVRIRLPHYVARPLLVWAVFQLLYAIPALALDARVWATAIGTRVIPMTAVFVGYFAVREPRDLRRVAWSLGVMVLVTLPAAIAVTAYGSNSVLPYWLRPIDAQAAVTGDYWKGMHIVLFAGPFSERTSMGLAMVAAGFLLLAAAGSGVTGPQRWLCWVALGASGALLFLSMNRMLMFSLLIGAAAYIAWRVPRRRRAQAAAWAALAAAAGGIALSLLSVPMVGPRARAYVDVDVTVRLRDVLALEAVEWVQMRPLGSYLGSGGREARVFGYATPHPLEFHYVTRGETRETGAALLATDMGLGGMVLMPVAMLWPVVALYRRSRRTALRLAIDILLLYQVLFLFYFITKAATALTTASVAAILFWSVPGVCAGLLAGGREPQPCPDGAGGTSRPPRGKPRRRSRVGGRRTVPR